MRKMISLSALVSGLLAAPGIVAPVAGATAAGLRPRGEEAGRGAVVVPEESQAETRERLQRRLLEMVEKGPEDVGGMRDLQRPIGIALRAHVAELLATAPDSIPPAQMTMPIQYAPDGPGAKIQFPPELREQTEKAGFLGVTASPVSAALRDQLGLTRGMGLVVDFVAKDSPAQAAGLKVHDVLTKFDDQLIVNIEQLAVLVRSKKDG